MLRSLIDESRRTHGRYFLLGSVSPELVRNVSETLAGRVGVLELTPFLFSEVAGRRGVMPGYPRLAEARIPRAVRDTRVVAITGPQQSGKTTLARRFAR